MNILEDLKLQYKIGGLVLKIIFWNVGIFIVFSLLNVVLKLSNIGFNYYEYVALPSLFSTYITKFWTLFTYMFIHFDFWHLFWNVVVLWFSSRYFLYYFTLKQFSFVYFFGGFFAGIVYLIYFQFLGVDTQLIGASGAILAVLMAVTIYAPYTQVGFFSLDFLKLWHISFFILFLDIIQMPFANFGGHLAHLGGALFGFIYVKLLQNGTDLSKGISKLQDGIEGLFSPKKKTPFKKVHKNTYQKTTFTKTTQEKDINQKKIDDILDKISKSGYDSLSKEEKEFLFKVGK
ncbi:rhomboid family intramembrane serine protease [Flavobacterium sp. TP390]|uniref:Rhomboid family intramembrane serine protease n=1 Tax=Flavobacterium profundi TaxID=1774945 RepID=A0A6I4IKZ5_9FLAO|nr:rhomboid family intramembrane serine protease [Flavobacterium profundi]MVO09219.1 rhomboid family intramembrane serine protease [Flavobacterium profundi]